MTPQNNQLLLDTQSWLWFVLGDPQLPIHVKELIEKALADGRAYLSVMSIWQLSDYVAQNRLLLKKSLKHWVDEALDKSAVQLAPIHADIAVESCQLSELNIKLDVTERIIVATARIMGASLVTTHPDIVEYAAGRYVEVICS